MRKLGLGLVEGVAVEGISILVVYRLVSELSPRYVDSTLFLVYVPMCAAAIIAIGLSVWGRAYLQAAGVVAGVLLAIFACGLVLYGA